MQNIKLYVAACETVGTVRDYANTKNVPPPTIVMGVETCLKMRLFAGKNSLVPFPLEQLSDVVSWQFVMDNDYDCCSPCRLMADNAHITLETITEIMDGTARSLPEISIPIPQTFTRELAIWLGTAKYKNGLSGELTGYDAEANPVFVLQIENFTVRNRVSGSGPPTPVASEFYTASQVDALLENVEHDPLVAGNGISISGDTISIDRSLLGTSSLCYEIME